MLAIAFAVSIEVYNATNQTSKMEYCPEGYQREGHDGVCKFMSNVNLFCTTPNYSDVDGGTCIRRCQDYSLESIQFSNDAVYKSSVFQVTTHPDYLWQNGTDTEASKLCKRCPSGSGPLKDKVSCIELSDLVKPIENCAYYDENQTCAVCAPGMQPSQDNACVNFTNTAEPGKQIANCKYYSVNACTNCSTEYILEAGKCEMAVFRNCSETNGTHCIRCIAGYQLNGTTCETCGETQYSDGITCKDCGAYCTCTVAQEKCTDCIKGYFLDTATTPPQCVKCADNCTNCTGVNWNQCTECNSSFSLSGTRCAVKCTLEQFDYVNETDGAQYCRDCSSLLSNCVRCYQPSNTSIPIVNSTISLAPVCVGCATNYYQVAGLCIRVPKLVLDSDGGDRRIIIMKSPYFWVIVAFFCLFFIAVVAFTMLCVVQQTQKRARERALVMENNSIVEGQEDKSFGSSLEDYNSADGSDALGDNEFSDDRESILSDYEYDASFESIAE